jgi:uncharacterized protein (DUF4415 family)
MLKVAVLQPRPPSRRSHEHRFDPGRSTRITIYLDDEVLNEFRTLSERCGTGYQTLINAALRNRLNGPTGETGVA